MNFQNNCKNCGAPLKHSYNHRCEYCGTLYDFNVPKENTAIVKPHEMVNLKYRGIEEDIMANSILIKFEGYKIEEPVIYEVNNKNVFVSKSIDYINPPKSYFFIQMPIYDLKKYGINYLWHILGCNIRPSEYENVKNQLIENESDFIKYQFY